jgi:perosamine synthetase
VKEFEHNFAQLVGVEHAIATSNGTTALHAALLAHDISPGDEVITTPFSFIATANAIRMTGATPVFVDIGESFNINPDLIESAITRKTKAILPVHLFGLPAEMDKIQQIAQKHGITIIEDACQAHGALYNGKAVGSFGTGCFSFYATKNMTTGEGGMITTNNRVVAEKIRTLIDHGSTKKYFHNTLGYNYRMMNITAALGVVQLQKLALFTERRRKHAWFLHEQLQSIPGVLLPKITENHVVHQYCIRITPAHKKTRAEVIQVLTHAGIGHAIFYPVPIHKQEAYATHNHLYLPVVEKMVNEVLALPVHPGLSHDDLQSIVTCLRSCSS